MNLKRSKRAFVLPTLILVTLVLLILATTLLAAGTGSLRTATHDQQTDQALYAAEAGLARAAAIFGASGSLADPYTDELDGASSRFEVRTFRNDGTGPKAVPGGPMIPPQTVYLRSEGFSENGTRRVTGALFTTGLEAIKVGVLGNRMEISNSNFDAYRSSEGDYNPSTATSDIPLLASNTNTWDGTPEGKTYTFNNATIHGDVLVGPGGIPDDQISNTDSTLGDTDDLNEEIKVEAIEAPKSEDGGEEGESDWDLPTLGPVELVEVNESGIMRFSDGAGLEFTVDSNVLAAGGAPFDSLSGPGAIYGTDPGPVDYVQLTLGPGHWLIMKDDGSATYVGPGTTFEVSPGGETLAAILWGKAPAPTPAPGGGLPEVTDPSTLAPGFYDKVTVTEGVTSNLSKSGTYIIKDLVIDGKLELPEDGESAKIYVTGSLIVNGENALANATRKPPRMQILYEGEQPVHLSGGSQSYFTLIAPKAEVNLTSPFGSTPTRFFGALVGDVLKVENTDFHFDLGTDGIGTGTMGSAVSLIHRHRI